MTKSKRNTLVLNLIDRLEENGSWCGETHIQKSLYFLQELAGVPTDFDFVLYKHGPFSFDLRDELSSMKADRLIKVKLQPYPYGPSLETTEASEALCEKFPTTLLKYKQQIDFIAQRLGGLGVADLERLATALYVTKKDIPLEKRAEKIHSLKPHVELDKAKQAVEDLNDLEKAFNAM